MDVKHALELIVVVAAAPETEIITLGVLAGGAAAGIYGTYKLAEKAYNKLMANYFTENPDKEAERARRKLIKYMNSKEYKNKIHEPWWK